MIGRIRRYARDHGMRATAAKSVARLREGVFSERRITVMRKDLDAIVEPRTRSHLQVLELDRTHLTGLSELNRERGRRSVDRRFRSNFDRGLHGFVGLRDGRTVGYYWWIEAERSERHNDLAWLGAAIPPDVGDVYGSDFYILPDHRSGGTANEFLFGVETSLRAKGFNSLWGYVDIGNREARWLYSSRGYQPIGDLTIHSFLNRKRATDLSRVGSPA